jgi:hypothetical protein
MRIAPNGNVGIGTTNPGAKLEVAGQVKITGGSPGAGRVLTSDASGLGTWQPPGGGGNVLTSNNGQHILVMQDDGNVVLYTPWGFRFATGTFGGRHGPSYLLSADGRYYLTMQGDANLVIYDTFTGQPIWATSWSPDGDWRPWLSDVRLKKDVTLLEGALAKVMRLRGVAFSWKDTMYGEGPQVGLIAQEVEKVFPEAVTTGGDGFKRVDYGRLVSPLIEAIKSQQIEIKKQEESIQQLQEELNKLKLKSESRV